VSSPQTHIRVLPDLRAKQVEESFFSTPCDVLYFDKNYDLGETAIPENFHQVNVLRAMVFLFQTKAAVLEIPEPLWIRFLPTSALLIFAWRLGSSPSKAHRRIVTYAIENNDFSRLIGGRRNLPTWLIFWVHSMIGIFISRFFERIAFGSIGAEKLYAPLLSGSAVQTRLFEELPARFQRTDEANDHFNRLGAIFVGRLEERKGLLPLLAAWPKVVSSVPGAILTIVGDGPLESVVTRWCALQPSRRFALGRLEHQEISSIMSANSVVVAPSIPWGRWREQIGLPISEGLAVGATIVTTSETGIADWLTAHGHRVLDVNSLETTLSVAVIDALEQPLVRSTVLNSLPDSNRRLDADLWMHGPA
jgi:glycosyltransferase involved in cell wall biosynthesis